MTLQVRWMITATMLLTATFGCEKAGPAIAPVAGRVTLEGSPLSNGLVGFISKNGFVSSAQLSPEGRFRLVSQFGDGIPLYEYSVTMTPLPKDSMLIEPAMESKSPEAKSDIPNRYQYPDKRGLNDTVSGRQSDL